MKIGDIVIAPNVDWPYLTSGKEYKVIEIYDNSPDDSSSIGFKIIDNDGDKISCRKEKCCHLGLRNWILKPTQS